MAQITKEQIFKYLTGFQLVMALLWWFIQAYGVETLNNVIVVLALIVLAGFLYVKDRNFKKDIQLKELPPDVRLAFDKLQRFIEGLLRAEINEDRESAEASGVAEDPTGTSEGDPQGDHPDYSEIS